MPGAQGSETRKRTKAVYVRLTPEEYAGLEYQAEAANLTLAALARARLNNRRVIAHTDAATIRELRRQGGIAMLAIQTRGMADAGSAALEAIRHAAVTLAARAS